MQRVWYSPNTMLDMVHSQAFLINFSSATWGCAEQLCGYKPWEPSPVPSKNTKKTIDLCHQLFKMVINKIDLMNVINVALHNINCVPVSFYLVKDKT
jgi:hypothetical protein